MDLQGVLYLQVGVQGLMEMMYLLRQQGTGTVPLLDPAGTWHIHPADFAPGRLYLALGRSQPMDFMPGGLCTDQIAGGAG